MLRKKLLKIMMKMVSFTPFFVKDKKFFNQIEKIDKLAIAFGHPKCEWCEKILLDFPVLMFKSIKNWYKLKFCNYKLFPEESNKIGVKFTPTLFLKTWEKIEIFEMEDKIKQKIKKF